MRLLERRINARIYELDEPGKLRARYTTAPRDMPVDFAAWRRGERVEFVECAPGWVRQGNEYRAAGAWCNVTIKSDLSLIQYRSKAGTGAVDLSLDRLGGARVARYRGTPQIRGTSLVFLDVATDYDLVFKLTNIGLRIFKRLKSSAAPKSNEWVVDELNSDFVQVNYRTEGQDNEDRTAVRDTDLRKRRDVQLTQEFPAPGRFRETWTGKTVRVDNTTRQRTLEDDVAYPVYIDFDITETVPGDQDGAATIYSYWGSGIFWYENHGWVQPSNKGHYSAHFRFTSVAVPNGATIDYCRFGIYINYVSGPQVDGMNWYFQGVDDAPAWSHGYIYGGGAPYLKNLATTNYDYIDVGTTGQKYATGMAAALQEIVNRAGWASGNDLRVMGFFTGNWVTEYIYFDEYFDSNPATLDVDYTVANIQSGAGSASGAGTASGIGTPVKPTDGTSAGVGATSGTGQSEAQAVGGSAGVGSATGVGQSDAQATGTTPGTSTATAVGQASRQGIASANGTATVAGVGLSASKAAGSANGIGAAASIGQSEAQMAGTAGGMATAAAVAQSKAQATGSSAGLGSGAAAGRALRSAIGASVGAAAASGIGQSLAKGDAVALGVASVSGVAQAEAQAVASSDGVAAAIGIGQSDAQAVGLSAGAATAIAQSENQAVGSSVGIAAAAGVGRAVQPRSGITTGIAVVSGVPQAIGQTIAASSGVSALDGISTAIVAAIAAAAGSSAAEAQPNAYVGTSAGTSTAAAISALIAQTIAESLGLGAVAGVGDTGPSAANIGGDVIGIGAHFVGHSIANSPQLSGQLLGGPRFQNESLQELASPAGSLSGPRFRSEELD